MTATATPIASRLVATRAGGDLADASVELTIAVADRVLIGDIPGAVPLAREALALARQIGAPALVATSLLAMGVAVAVTDPGQAQACLRESRELSATLGYHGATDLVWATAIAALTHDRTGTIELGSHAIRGLRRGGDRLRMAVVLHMIADALAGTRAAPAAIIHGAADAFAVAPPNPAGPLSGDLSVALGDEHAQELRTRGASMDWDQAVAYALTQTAQALDELQREPGHERAAGDLATPHRSSRAPAARPAWAGRTRWVRGGSLTGLPIFATR